MPLRPGRHARGADRMKPENRRILVFSASSRSSSAGVPRPQPRAGHGDRRSGRIDRGVQSDDDRMAQRIHPRPGFVMLGLAPRRGGLEVGLPGSGLPRLRGVAGPDCFPNWRAPAAPRASWVLRRLDFAISLIALVAGGEIKASFLRGMLGRIATVLGVQIGHPGGNRGRRVPPGASAIPACANSPSGPRSISRSPWDCPSPTRRPS